MINVDELISWAAKTKSPALPVYRLIKAEFLRWTKDNPGKQFDASVEAKILKKMYDQRCESIEIYKKNARNDLVEAELLELSAILPFMPKEPSAEEVELCTVQIIKDIFEDNVSMKDVKKILSLVQEKLPGASGKLVSQVVKEHIK